MMRSLRRPGSLWLLTALLTACGDGPVDIVETEEPLVLTGIWDFTEVLLRSSQPVVCRDTGSYRITVEGRTLRGEGEKVGTCNGLIGTFPSDRSFSFMDGEVNDTVVEFVVPGACGLWNGERIDARYRGTVSRGPPMQMSGTSACSVNFNGSWRAMPAAPATSVYLQPDSADMMIDETIYLTPFVYSASGARLFKRALVWSSEDTTVVRVGEAGDVVGTGVGSATVSAQLTRLTARSRITAGAVRFASVQAGAFHTCGISDKGDVYCWGANDEGQSGPAPSLAPCPGVKCRHAPGLVPGSVPFGSLSAGGQHTCGVADDGVAYCWGANSNGQLGVDLATPGTKTPLAVSGDHRFARISTGPSHACGVTTSGSAYCWGYNSRGQVGPGAADPTGSPNLVTARLTFESAVAGGLHSCGLTSTGAAYCWGWNWDGQLGNDTIPASAEPLEVSGAIVFASLTAGASHNCGLTAQGVAYCWGAGEQGQLGSDSADYRATPVPASGGLRFATISAGARHTCGLLADGSAYCWGEGSRGQLGNGSSENADFPVPVAGNLRFASISGGEEHTCGLTVDGVAYCWGSNYNGQLGQALTIPSAVPLKVIGQQ